LRSRLANVRIPPIAELSDRDNPVRDEERSQATARRFDAAIQDVADAAVKELVSELRASHQHSGGRDILQLA
jgi:hypothetical protein